ncbi:hypothetical protein D9C73_006953 [Collichthys lucidus]|uniref:Uncharacterized protein n=1 Tax=Collichthys lucidus TaxID=240159 RepID=A0A4U5UE47_COLLU|nr:hypothetical protein D9C73_006953 [Collichthys lucidus]
MFLQLPSPHCGVSVGTIIDTQDLQPVTSSEDELPVGSFTESILTFSITSRTLEGTMMADPRTQTFLEMFHSKQEAAVHQDQNLNINP